LHKAFSFSSTVCEEVNVDTKLSCTETAGSRTAKCNSYDTFQVK
jgi:hypothetical protein